MPANKIILNKEVLIDLTTDTVTQNDVKKGVTFHGRDGVEYEGTYEVALQTKVVTPTEESQEVTPDADYEGLSKVTVEAIPEEYVVPSGDKTIVANGENIDVKQYETVTVRVPNSGGTGSDMPIEIASEEEMTAILTGATPTDSGRVYKYIGDGGRYYLGTQDDDITISSIHFSALNTTTSGVSQFPAQFATVDAEGVFSVQSSPAVGTAYKLYLTARDGLKYCFNGLLVGNVLQTSTTVADAVDVYLEAVYADDGSTIIGYRFYFTNNEVKTYIDIAANSNIVLVTENPVAVYKHISSPSCWSATVGAYTKNAYYKLEVRK